MVLWDLGPWLYKGGSSKGMLGWCTPLIPTLTRQRQGDPEFKVSLVHTASLGIVQGYTEKSYHKKKRELNKASASGM